VSRNAQNVFSKSSVGIFQAGTYTKHLRLGIHGTLTITLFYQAKLGRRMKS